MFQFFFFHRFVDTNKTFFFNSLAYPTLAAMSLKFCGAVEVLRGQFLNEVEFMLKSQSTFSVRAIKWYITFDL